MRPHVPPLLSVSLLFRSKTAFSGLPHVVDLVSVYADSSVELRLNKACEFESVKLLDRIWDSSEVYTEVYTYTPDSWSLKKFLRTDKHYKQYQFSLCMEDAVVRQDLEMIKWLSTKFETFTIKSEEVVKACKVGAMDILQLFLEKQEVGWHSVEWGKFSISAAVQSRRSDIVWWLHRHIPNADYDLAAALKSAITTGDIVMADWLVAHGAPWFRADIIRTGVAQGRVDVLEWIAERGHFVNTIPGLVASAAEKGHFEVVCWLVLERNAPPDLFEEVDHGIHAAASHDHLEVAKYLREYMKTTTMAPRRSTQTGAEIPGRQEQLNQWMETPAVTVCGKTMVKAARNGYLDVVKWLYAEYGDNPDLNLFETGEKKHWPLSIDTVAMDTAAHNGHHEVVKYLHNLQASIDARGKKRTRDQVRKISRPKCTKRAIAGAAANGHLNVVQWLCENRKEGCSTRAMDVASSFGHLHVVQWLDAHRPEGCSTNAIDSAAHNGHLEVVKWLHENTEAGCTTRAMDTAAGSGHLDIVKWLHEHRSEGCTVDAIDNAASQGNLEVVKWLHANRTEGCSELAMSAAAEEGHVHMMEWLFRHCNKGCISSAIIDTAAFNRFEAFLFLHTQLHEKVTGEAASWSFDNHHTEIHDWILHHYPEYRDMFEHEVDDD